MSWTRYYLLWEKAQYNQCIFVNFSCTFYETEEENSAEKCVT